MTILLFASSIELFENLSQYKFDTHYYDLHNDYDCEGVSLKENVLYINFKQEVNGESISLVFTEVEVKQFEFFNATDTKNLTIDNVYRGKAVIYGEIKELFGEKGYFYLEFYEGQRIEFWAKSVGIENTGTIRND